MPPFLKEVVLTSLQPLMGLVEREGRRDLRTTEDEKDWVSFDIYLFLSLTRHVAAQATSPLQKRD